MTIDHSLRDRISKAVTEALRPLPAVFAGWEGDLAFARDPGDLETKLARASAWGNAILRELEPV
jgi:hypothetical protein